MDRKFFGKKIGPKSDLHGSKVGLFSENDHLGVRHLSYTRRQAPYFFVLGGGRQRFEGRNADILMSIIWKNEKGATEMSKNCEPVLAIKIEKGGKKPHFLGF